MSNKFKPQPWHKEAIELSEQGYSGRQIAAEIGMGKSQVNDFLAYYRENKEVYLSQADDGYGEVVTQNQFLRDNIKMLFIDIETSKILAYVWGLFNQTISIKNVVEDWYLLCFSAQWLGSDEIISESLHHYPLNGRYRFNEKYLVDAAWKLLDEAKYVVAYNGKRFDKKKLNAKFLEYGYPEPSPYKIIDPYLIVKGNFALTSNKLDWVERILNHAGKHDTNDQLWIDCMNDDVEALEYMATYCDNDVAALVRDYMKLRHWDKTAPNLALEFDDSKPRCNCCGSDDLELIPDTYAKTSLSKFSVYRCNGCSKVLRDRNNILSKEKRKSLLMNVL